MISELIKERKLPPLREREEMVKLLLEKEYGILPGVECKVSVSEPTMIEERFCGYAAELSSVEMTVKSNFASHTFRVGRLLHNDGEKRPFFVLLNFSPDMPDKYYPVEEIAEEGFDVLSVCYTDISGENSDFSDGLAKVLLPNGRESGTTCGKIMLWAWAASRILDYAETLPGLDMNNAAVVGHSRLGKTALVAAMLDTRFKYAFSNDSGCSGAAIARGGMGVLGLHGDRSTGETIEAITKAFPYWFCKNYRQFAETNIPEGFDQHFLLASIAPRFCYVSSASMDDWADPNSEFLSCVAASEKYEELGYSGLVHSDKLPEIGEYFHEGRIGYHKRFGAHFLSRRDWHGFMKFINLHKDDTVK